MQLFIFCQKVCHCILSALHALSADLLSHYPSLYTFPSVPDLSGLEGKSGLQDDHDTKVKIKSKIRTLALLFPHTYTQLQLQCSALCGIMFTCSASRACQMIKWCKFHVS